MILEPGELVEFVQNADFKKDYKTSVKLIISSSLRPPRLQNIQFYTSFVSFFDIVNSHKIDVSSVASNLPKTIFFKI